jgi:hypothetical protein
VIVRRHRLWVVLAGLASLLAAAGTRTVLADAPTIAGCQPGSAAVAHLPGGAVVQPQPSDAPVLCRAYTGFPGGESRIEVTNDGTVMFSPAPYDRGLLSLGYGPDDQPTASQWMFNNGGIAVSHDLGAHWALTKPADATWTMDDAFSYYDRVAGRYFWVALNTNPFPQVQNGAPPPVDQAPLAQSHVMFTDDDGTHWGLGSMCCPISDRAPLVAAVPPAGGARPANGYPNVLYFCHEFGTQTGTCQKSLDGGLNWTFTGFDHRAGPSSHAECGTSSESTGRSGWDSLGPMPDGSVLDVLTCGGNAYLTRTSDEGATWPILYRLPHAGDLRIDDSGNLYLAELSSDSRQLLLSTSQDGGRTWSPELNVAAPGATHIHADWYYTVRHPGEVMFTYNASQPGKTTYDGYLTATRSGLTAQPLLWSARVNDPASPLLYGESLQGVGLVSNDTPPPAYAAKDPPQVDQVGSAIAPDGTAWASYTEDCGPDPSATKCQSQHGQTRGLAARLVWPPG